MSVVNTISVDSAIDEALMNDMTKTLDLAVRTVYRSTNIKIKYATTGTAAAPTSTFDTDGTQSTAWTRDGQAWDVRELVGYLDNTLFAPPLEGDQWVCISARDGFNRGIFESSNFTDVAIRQEGGKRIFRGETLNYYSMRFVTETNAFSTKTGTYRGEFAAIGKESIYEAVALAPHIRLKEKTDYQRNLGMAWYSIIGFAQCHDVSTAGFAKVIHGTSA